ncbi:alpha/beta hydrolase [Tropicimonas marinistellae]|uniref:alpha/beta hydrolase n=1 Tax=Tropicimonas marinistellae TaxID=1739787 RepID=UPI000AD3482D|nr:alpha/beta-hydrolase family protein [Tropicimonas marinistellae]
MIEERETPRPMVDASEQSGDFMHDPVGGGPKRRMIRAVSSIGLLFGAVLFAASLTPSLIPRSFLLQGVLGGVCLAAGYGIGTALDALWRYMELPVIRGRIRFRLTIIAGGAALALVAASLWKAPGWQNSIRIRMDMPPVDEAHSLEVAVIALIVFAGLLGLWRLFAGLSRIAGRQMSRVVPTKVARVFGIATALVLFTLLIDGVLIRSFLHTADLSAAALDAAMDPQIPPPTDPDATGGTHSLIRWEGLGRTGRQFVSTGPTAEEISAFLERPAKAPLRIYAGLNAAPDTEARAALAVQEMLRRGAFERDVLLVVVPTGTGWMDPEAMDTFEYLHAGDTAIVAIQYSYLSSWISVLAEPGIGIEAGRALFQAVYRHWIKLPSDNRPKLYVQGLSLGAYSAEQSVHLHEVLADPIHGALLSGPPYDSPIWRALTRNRNEGTPAWLPRYGDGAVVRFTNQDNQLEESEAEWGPMRVVYLQYASDPITFFRADALFRKPPWLEAPVGPDVSPEMRWYPVVTFLQLGLDMAIGLLVPMGFGHLFAPEHYIDGWIAVTDPQGWNAEDIDRLKAFFVKRSGRG